MKHSIIITCLKTVIGLFTINVQAINGQTNLHNHQAGIQDEDDAEDEYIFDSGEDHSNHNDSDEDDIMD